MTKQLTDADAEVGSRNRKPWFLPALAVIVLIGIALMVVASRAGGPPKPLLDPAAAFQSNARFEKAMTLLDQGNQNLTTGRFAEAMQLAEQALALCPELVRAHLIAAQIALQTRDYDRAQREFQEVLRRQANHEQSLLSLAAIAAIRKDYDGARKQIAQALTSARVQDAARSIPLLILQAAAHLDQPEAAARYMSDALQQDAGPDAVLLEAKDFGPEVLTLLADTCDLRNLPVAAARVYAQAAQNTAGPLVRAQRAGRAAELYLAAGTLDAATEQLRVALDADPANPKWLVLRDRITAANPQGASSGPATIRAPAFGLSAN